MLVIVNFSSSHLITGDEPEMTWLIWLLLLNTFSGNSQLLFMQMFVTLSGFLFPNLL